MEKLPKSIIELIFTFSERNDICKFSSVCKKWNRGKKKKNFSKKKKKK